MEYNKSRWASTSSGDSQANPSQAIETFNSVTFSSASTNGQSNPIIISTQHPSHISITRVHEVRQASDMASPTDSFHSVVSSFPNEKREGRTNLAYTGSNTEVNNQSSHNQQVQSQHPTNRVLYQSYWSWNWPWEGWNQREKIFLLIIVILSLCILSLTSVLSVVIQKNIEYRNLLLQKVGIVL